MGSESSSKPSPRPPDIPGHELVRLIGRGAYGDVWLGRNVLGSYRAIKIVRRDNFDEQRPYDREYEGVRNFEPLSLSHANQISILHVGRNDEAGFFYYVMDLADPLEESIQPTNSSPDSSKTNATTVSEDSTTPPSTTIGIDPATYKPRTLKEELARHKKLEPSACLEIVYDLARALQDLHTQGLIHRDIEPSNIIYVEGTPKLSDIGLVAASGSSQTLVGTEGYFPPEGPGDITGDRYSLGIVLFDVDRFGV